MYLSLNEMKIIYVLGKGMQVDWNNYEIYKQKHKTSKEIAKLLNIKYIPYANLNLLIKKGFINKDKYYNRPKHKQNKYEYGLTYKGAKLYKKLKPNFRFTDLE